MQDARDLDSSRCEPVDDEMLAGREEPVLFRYGGSGESDRRIVEDHLQSIVQDLAVGQQLALTPGLQGLLENASEIVLGLWGKNELPVRGRHPD